MPAEPYTSADAIARTIIEKTGGQVRLALPLGLGKANRIANALTRAALDDPSIDLRILTALTLQRPGAGSELERRFLEPAGDRLFGQYEPLLYADLLQKEELPANIEVREFFFQAGRWLGNEDAQRHYISANYTHAFDYLLDFEPNVIAQLLAVDESGRFNLSCNTDISADLLKARRKGRADFLMAGEVNRALPFMGGPAVCSAGEVDLLFDEPDGEFELFSVVRRPVSAQDMAVGLHVSRLIRDGGTLQIGIGSIGDAIAEALMLRHRDNQAYQDVLAANPFPAAAPEDNRDTFSAGLYSVTEMLVGGILELFEAGIIRREVDGAAIHAGFFVECRDFYEKLRSLPREKRDRIHMMPVSFTNALYGQEAEKRAARTDARFVNNAMIATCLGGVTSDATEDGRVVSGVGGQFNFVAQAFALRGGRSIITLNATRESQGKTVSNIHWSYPNETVPRHYRDIVVTEYGIADLRGKSDEECVIAMIGIADSRFQKDLLAEAKKAGKVRADYELPGSRRLNTPDRLKEWLGPYRRNGLLPAYPFGTDFDETEQALLPALSRLKNASHSTIDLARMAWRGARRWSDRGRHGAALRRLELEHPSSAMDFAYALVVLGALSAEEDT